MRSNIFRMVTGEPRKQTVKLHACDGHRCARTPIRALSYSCHRGALDGAGLGK
jgi:hypothetical protein